MDLTKLPISLHVIVKDEIKNIMGLLAQADKLFAQVVICDTGSTDGTLRILQGQADIGAIDLVQMEWGDDFADARNKALRKCLLPWIMWLDADDLLDENTIRQMKTPDFLKILKDPSMIYFTCRPPNKEYQWSQLRLFPNYRGIYWENRLHEQIAPSLLKEGIDNKVVIPSLTITHYGYEDPALNIAKQQRNVRILKLMPQNPIRALNLAKSYSILGMDADAELELLPHTIKKDDQNEDIRNEIIFELGRIYVKMGKNDDAMRCFQESASPDALFFLAELIFLTSTDGGHRAAKEIYQQYINRGEPNNPVFPTYYQQFVKICVDRLQDDRFKV